MPRHSLSSDEDYLEEPYNTWEVCLIGPPGAEPRTEPHPSSSSTQCSNEAIREPVVYQRNSASIALGPFVSTHQLDQVQPKDFQRSELECTVEVKPPSERPTTTRYTRTRAKACTTLNSYPFRYNEESSEETDSSDESEHSYSPGEDTEVREQNSLTGLRSKLPSKKIVDSATVTPRNKEQSNMTKLSPASTSDREPDSCTQRAEESPDEQEEMDVELKQPSTPLLPQHDATLSLSRTQRDDVTSPSLAPSSAIEEQQVTTSTADDIPLPSNLTTDDEDPIVRGSVVTVADNHNGDVSTEEKYLKEFQENPDWNSETDDDQTPSGPPPDWNSETEDDQTPSGPPLALSNSFEASGLLTVLSDLKNSFSNKKRNQCTLEVSTVDVRYINSIHSDTEEERKMIVSISVPHRSPVVYVEKLSLSKIQQLKKEFSPLQNTTVS